MKTLEPIPEKRRRGMGGCITPTLDDKVRSAIIRSGAKLFKEGDLFYHSLDLSGVQYNVLRVLEEAGVPLQQQEIARRVFASRANVTCLLDQLEARGLIERAGSADRRVKMISLTSKACKMLAETYGEFDVLTTMQMSNLTDPEKRELLRLLGKLEGNAGGAKVEGLNHGK